jgi:hypothetical protein
MWQSRESEGTAELRGNRALGFFNFFLEEII